ncbi:hypothetical protein D3C81_1040480 [compost metagenome]
MVALAIERSQGGRFVPVLQRQLDRRWRHRGTAGAVDQRTTDRLQQLVAAQRLDQGVAEAGLTQACVNGSIAVGGMRQRRGVRVRAAQLVQQLGTIAIGQVDVDQPQIVGTGLGARQGAGQ